MKPIIKSQLGGISNHSFLVSDGSHQWVIRLNARELDVGIDRGSELLVMKHAGIHGLAPSIAHFSDEILVTEYIEGRSPSTSHLEDIGRCFARIHALDVSIASLDLRAHLHNYFQQVDPDPVLAACYRKVLGLSQPAEAKAVVCHHDLLLENMLLTPAGIVVIDWEYARISDAAYDLAVFVSHYNLDENQLTRLLGAYHPLESRLVERIRYFQKIYQMIEILWWHIRGKVLDEKIENLLSGS